MLQSWPSLCLFSSHRHECFDQTLGEFQRGFRIYSPSQGTCSLPQVCVQIPARQPPAYSEQRGGSQAGSWELPRTFCLVLWSIPFGSSYEGQLWTGLELILSILPDSGQPRALDPPFLQRQTASIAGEQEAVFAPWLPGSLGNPSTSIQSKTLASRLETY